MGTVLTTAGVVLALLLADLADFAVVAVALSELRPSSAPVPRLGERVVGRVGREPIPRGAVRCVRSMGGLPRGSVRSMGASKTGRTKHCR